MHVFKKSQVWFQNRRAKWRKQARLQLLQDAWRMRCLGLSNPPMVMPNNSSGSGGNGGNRQTHSSDNAKSQSPPLAHSPPTTASTSLSSSSSTVSSSSPTSSASIQIASTNHPPLTTSTSMSTNGSTAFITSNSFTLMHPAFQAPASALQHIDKLSANEKLSTSSTSTSSPSPIINKNGSMNLSLTTPLAATHMASAGILTYSADFSLKTGYNGKMLSNGMGGAHYMERIDEQNSHHINRICGNNGMDHDGSGDESDSEEIDLTSNGCIDFSNNNNNNKCQ